MSAILKCCFSCVNELGEAIAGGWAPLVTAGEGQREERWVVGRFGSFRKNVFLM